MIGLSKSTPVVVYLTAEIMGKRSPKILKPRAPALPAPAEMVDLPKRLSDEIKDQDLTATEVAQRANVKLPTITRAMKGEQFAGMQAANVIRIAKALGVRPGWLLTGEQPKTTHGLAAVSDSALADRIASRIVEAITAKAAGPQVIQDKPVLPNDHKS